MTRSNWQTSDATLSRSDEHNARKISAIAGGVPRDEGPLLNFGMRPDVEIRQRRSLRAAAAATVFQKTPARLTTRRHKAKAAAEKLPDRATDPDRRRSKKPVPVRHR